MKKRKAVIQIDYPGSVISVNHYKGRRRDGGTYVKAEALAWQVELGWTVKELQLDDWKLPLHITCDGFFKDARSAPDISNLSKVINDSIEAVCKHNDRDFRWHDGDRNLAEPEPYLIITIEEG